MANTLRTTTAVIDALGGNQAVADMTSTGTSAISNWRTFNKFPANTYVAIRQALFDRGFVAPDSLWSMRQPANRRRKSA